LIKPLYVWFDALLGYVTALLDAIANPPWKMLCKVVADKLHLIGKDILLPCSLLACNADVS